MKISMIMSYSDKNYDKLLNRADSSIPVKGTEQDVNKKLVKIMKHKNPRLKVIKILKFNRNNYEILVQFR